MRLAYERDVEVSTNGHRRLFVREACHGANVEVGTPKSDFSADHLVEQIEGAVDDRLGEDEAEAAEVYLDLIMESRRRVIAKQTARDSIGAIIFSKMLRYAPELQSIYRRGAMYMAQAFETVLATMVSFAGDLVSLDQSMRILGLRHVHYFADLDDPFQYFPILQQAVLVALEQGAGAGRRVGLEREAWTWLWNGVAELLMSSVSASQRRVESLLFVWNVINDEFGIETFQYKLHANLMVDAESLGMRAKTTAVGVRVTSINSNELHHRMARELCDLLGKMVRIVTDLEHLKGLNKSLGLGTQPGTLISQVDIKKLSEVAIKTLKEILGARWDAAQQEVWSWLWYRSTIVDSWGILRKSVSQKLTDEGKLAPSVDATPQLPEGSHGPLAIREVDATSETSSATTLSTRSDHAREVMDRKRTAALSQQQHQQQQQPQGGGGPAGDKKRDSINVKSPPPRTSIVSSSRRVSAFVGWGDAQEETASFEDIASEIGIVFLHNLFSNAPTLQKLFVRPSATYGRIFGQILKMLLAHLDDPAEVWQNNKELALRHIKHGVRPSHVPLFSKLIVETFASIGGEEWTAEHTAAWQALWEVTGSELTKVLNAGNHPVICVYMA
ncbi:unnamed protein product [Vitrella brassicaformis CCMP3155]|uniref:Globin domain-containing protein n=1 Tax=Vitrella brassicaformis (strain CCMP3155) TaxID=1169540 RepID=A0A0G4H5Q5_VITBC|nr:unnamed protein product [Vitrella brassicaformis CCMP3155]|eukprot:CEM39167.1 unnamed protein product [Vitrella brassicaformis CCMP3155]